MTEFVKEYRARKRYRCSGCGDAIQPGQRYSRCTIMEYYEGDVDDYGRSVAVKMDKPVFYVERYHVEPKCEKVW